MTEITCPLKMLVVGDTLKPTFSRPKFLCPLVAIFGHFAHLDFSRLLICLKGHIHKTFAAKIISVAICFG